MGRCLTCEGEGQYADDYGEMVNCPDCVKGRERIQEEDASINEEES